MYRSVALALLVAACGGGSSSGADSGAAIDAAVATADASSEGIYDALNRTTPTTRLSIRKFDADRGVCARGNVTLNVVTDPAFGVVVMPESWGISEIDIRQATSCNGEPSADELVIASSAIGTVTRGIARGSDQPCSVSFEVAADFDAGESWVPPRELWVGTDLPAQPCNI